MADSHSLSGVRLQAAIVRALLDELDRIVPSAASVDASDAITTELADELERLGARLRDGATELRSSIVPPPRQSGIECRDDGFDSENDFRGAR